MNLIKLWICALVALATFNLNVLAQRQKEPGKPQLTEEERSLQAENKRKRLVPVSLLKRNQRQAWTP